MKPKLGEEKNSAHTLGTDRDVTACVICGGVEMGATKEMGANRNGREKNGRE